MEVHMKKVIGTILVSLFVGVFGVAASYAQQGTRVEANIPFDFTVGKKTFASGNYQLLLTQTNASVYSASLIDSDGRQILRTLAIRNGRTLRDRSEMVFAVSGGDRYLETIKTPEAGFAFALSISDKRVAEAKHETIPASGAPNFE